MKNIFKGLQKSANKIIFKGKQNSPEILLAAGVIGLVGTAVLAGKASRKLDDILDEQEDTVEKIHAVQNGDIVVNSEYTDLDAKKDLAITYGQTAVKVAKLYAPTFIVGGLSIAALIGSHGIQAKRYAGLATAYSVLDTSFKKYRQNVKSKYGIEADRLLRANATNADEGSTVDADSKPYSEGKKHKAVAKEDGLYTRFYDEGNEGYNYRNRDLSMSYLKAKQSYLNRLLQDRGNVTLNDALNELGYTRTDAGMVVGWIRDDSFEDHRDNYIDFGIFDADGNPDVSNKNVRDFLNGTVPALLLEFNVDGVIYGKVDKHSWMGVC